MKRPLLLLTALLLLLGGTAPPALSADGSNPTRAKRELRALVAKIEADRRALGELPGPRRIQRHAEQTLSQETYSGVGVRYRTQRYCASYSGFRSTVLYDSALRQYFTRRAAAYSAGGFCQEQEEAWDRLSVREGEARRLGDLLNDHRREHGSYPAAMDDAGRAEIGYVLPADYRLQDYVGGADSASACLENEAGGFSRFVVGYDRSWDEYDYDNPGPFFQVWGSCARPERNRP